MTPVHHELFPARLARSYKLIRSSGTSKSNHPQPKYYALQYWTHTSSSQKRPCRIISSLSMIYSPTETMQDQRTLPDNTCRALCINIQLPNALFQINIVPEVSPRQATGNIPNQPIRFVLISSLDYQIAGSLSCNVWQSTKAARLIETNLHVPQCSSLAIDKGLLLLIMFNHV